MEQWKESPTPIWCGASVAPVGFGFFALVIFWWYPFAFILSGVGFVIGLICLIRGVRGRYGENFPLIGMSICGIVFGVIFTLTQLLHYVIWDH
jgi:hypothetical protein